MARRGFGVGRACTRSWASARQSSRSGQAGQRGATWRAQGRAKIHQCLGVVGKALLRQSCRGLAPQRALDRGQAGEAIDAGMAREHAFDIAIEDCDALAMSLREDGGGGAAADAGQRDELLQRARQLAVVICDTGLCGALQVAGAAVVAEPGPAGEHLVLRRLLRVLRCPGSAPRSVRSTQPRSRPGSAAASPR